VDVACALLDRGEQNHVHQAHDRRVLARLLELQDVELLVVLAEVDLPLVESSHHVVVSGPDVVVPLDRGHDGRLGGYHGLDVQRGEKLDVVDGVQVRGVRHGDDEGGAGTGQREDLVLFGHVLRHELEHLGVDLVLVEVDRGDAVLRREEVRHLAVGYVPELGERVAEVVPALALLVLRLPELLQTDQLLANEELTQPGRIWCHDTPRSRGPASH
jgi:hypothetical protein